MVNADDKLRKFSMLPITNTVAIRKDHIEHPISVRRFTFVAFYCETCNKFTHRNEVRRTPTRHEMRLLTWPDSLRAKHKTTRTNNIPYNPEVVKIENERREKEEEIDA
ncbi:MAG: hypothetical protein ACYDG3_12405 [Bacillati bacterium]